MSNSKPLADTTDQDGLNAQGEPSPQASRRFFDQHFHPDSISCRYHQAVFSDGYANESKAIAASPMERFLTEKSEEQPAVFIRPDNDKLSITKDCTCRGAEQQPVSFLIPICRPPGAIPPQDLAPGYRTTGGPLPETTLVSRPKQGKAYNDGGNKRLGNCFVSGKAQETSKK